VGAGRGVGSTATGFGNRGTSASLGSRFNGSSAFGNASFSNARYGGGFGRGYGGYGWRGGYGYGGWHGGWGGGFGWGFGWGLGWGLGFGWGGWGYPWWGGGWGWGYPYAYYNPYWDWPPYGYSPYPYDYPPPSAAPNDQPNNSEPSLYGPYSSDNYGDYGSGGNGQIAEGTPDTDPVTANVAEFAPSILVYLKDGEMLVANDYWLADGQFHYTVKYGGENAIPVNDLDLQRTVDENAKRGVRFSLKPKPAMNPDGTVDNRPSTGGAAQNRGNGASPAVTAPAAPAPAAHPALTAFPAAA
jgi:hypothetical protein